MSPLAQSLQDVQNVSKALDRPVSTVSVSGGTSGPSTVNDPMSLNVSEPTGGDSLTPNPPHGASTGTSPSSVPVASDPTPAGASTSSVPPVNGLNGADGATGAADVPSVPSNPSTFSAPQPAVADPAGVSGPSSFSTSQPAVMDPPGTSGPSTFHNPSPGSAPSGPSTFSNPQGPPGTSGPSTFSSPGAPTVSGPSTFATPNNPAVINGPSTFSSPNGPSVINGPSTFTSPAGPNVSAPSTFSTPSAPNLSGPSTLTVPDGTTDIPGDVTANPSIVVTGPSTLSAPAVAPGEINTAAAAGGETTTTTVTVGPAPSGSGGVMSAPWLLDIIHYFQFITLTGQLQLDYPSIFATFTRIFNFANGGVRISFIELASSAWASVAPTYNTTSPPPSGSLGSLVTPDDVGLTSFVIQSGLQPAIFFPMMLLMMLLTFGISMTVSGVVAGGLWVWGEVKGTKEVDGDSKGSLGRKVSSRKMKKIRERRLAVLMRFCVANLVRTWMILQYPLTVASGYWLSHFAYSSAAPISITLVSSITLILLCLTLPTLLILQVLTTKPRDALYTNPKYLETLGPLYDHYRRDRVWFCAVQIGYFALQGLVVGLYPKNSPRRLVDTLGTSQWLAALFQPILLVIIEVALMVILYKGDPYEDRFSGRVQWAVCLARFFALVAVCCFGAPEYKKVLSESDSRQIDSVRANDTGSSVGTFKGVMSYFGALVHTLLLLSLLVLMLRRAYLWAKQFYLSRRAASAVSSTGDRSSGTRRVTFFNSFKKKTANDEAEEDLPDGKGEKEGAGMGVTNLRAIK
ncbi:hypothetical protein HDU67_007546 [Dinochytrium kinnereticum]|nr:hypothetical protein HDU67_007546 [Dinochytrium kinnereticum]